ncbi:MAG: PilZ domain-containing protein [Acidobacteria bacterium]|nr:PilZ domain-containing protein [Acidobacteriota bacterium]
MSTAYVKENRRIQRIALPLPVRVEVKIDANVSWNEITRLQDVSAFGAGFMLKRPTKRGRLIMLTIPMPRQLRVFDFTEPQYKIWGIVRRCIDASSDPENPQYACGVAFIGKTPPDDYIANPSRLYDITHREDEGLWHIGEMDLDADDSDLPKDLRKQTRFPIPEPLVIELLDESGEVIKSESTVTENISYGGAAIFTQWDLEPGTFVRVVSLRHDLKIISVVRGRRLGSDGIPRLHLEFIDRFFPLEGID